MGLWPKNWSDCTPLSWEEVQVLAKELGYQIIDDPGGHLTYDELEAIAAEMKARNPLHRVAYHGPPIRRERPKDA